MPAFISASFEQPLLAHEILISYCQLKLRRQRLKSQPNSLRIVGQFDETVVVAPRINNHNIPRVIYRVSVCAAAERCAFWVNSRARGTFAKATFT